MSLQMYCAFLAACLGVLVSLGSAFILITRWLAGESRGGEGQINDQALSSGARYIDIDP